MAGIVVFSREECETSDTSDAQKKINKLDAGEAVARLARGCYRFRAVCKILSILRWRIHSIELRCGFELLGNAANATPLKACVYLNEGRQRRRF